MQQCVDGWERTLLGGMGEWTEDKVGERVEPAVEMNHAAVHDARVGEMHHEGFAHAAV